MTITKKRYDANRNTNIPIQDSPPEILDKLQAGVQSITDSESFRAYLNVQAKFHRYSVNNIILILMQNPDATRVMGYGSRDKTTGWLSLNRQVRAGERAIKILAPLLRKETNPDTGDVHERLYGFKPVNVFDVAQTDGDPLPQPVRVPVLDSYQGARLYHSLAMVAHSEGLSIRPLATDGKSELMGFYRPTEKIIAVRTDVPQLQRTKTLAHELAHHYHGAHDLFLSSREEHETIAESVAYVVLAHHGLDSGERSFPYIAHWAEDKSTLRQALGKIQRVSGVIIDKIETTSSNGLFNNHNEGTT